MLLFIFLDKIQDVIKNMTKDVFEEIEQLLGEDKELQIIYNAIRNDFENVSYDFEPDEYGKIVAEWNSFFDTLMDLARLPKKTKYRQFIHHR